MATASFPRWLPSTLSVATLALLAGCSFLPTETPPAPANATASAEAPAPVTADPATYVAIAKLDYAGSQKAREALTGAIAAAGRDNAALTALAKKLLELLAQTDCTPAGRQAICEQLGTVLAVTLASPQATVPPVLVGMLTSEKEVDLARLALENIPGRNIDAAFLTALGQAGGRTRVALVQSVGNRRIAGAVGTLAELLKNSDPATAASATRALGQIGTSAALAALRLAPNFNAPAVVEARLACARQLPSVMAIPALAEVSSDATLPAQVRVAALIGQLQVEPATAPTRVGEVLAGDNPVFKQAVITALPTLLKPDQISALAAKLPGYDAPTQVALLATFGRAGDKATVPAVLTEVQSPTAEVRAAALEALGMLPGNTEVALTLARLAATIGADAKLARQSLARLHGPGVAETVLAGAKRAGDPLRIVFIEQLGLRNADNAVAVLMQTRDDSDAAVRAAALGALTPLATFAEQPALIDWVASASDSTENSRAVRALVAASERQTDPALRIQAIAAALPKAKPAGQARLMTALSRLGGAAAAEALVPFALGDDAAAAEAAVTNLGRWPDDTAVLALTAAAEKAATEARKKTALTTVVQMIADSRVRRSPEHSEALVRLMALAQGDELRLRLLGLLARCADSPARKLASRLQEEPALAEAARYAELAIRANAGWPPAVRTSANASKVKNAFDGKFDNAWTVSATAEQWLEIDFKRTRPLRRLALDQTGRESECPAQYEVFLTDDPQAPGKAVASGNGTRGKATVIELSAGAQGRYLIIKNTTERKDPSWSVCEVVLD